jgi:hypothetical protein
LIGGAVEGVEAGHAADAAGGHFVAGELGAGHFDVGCGVLFVGDDDAGGVDGIAILHHLVVDGELRMLGILLAERVGHGREHGLGRGADDAEVAMKVGKNDLGEVVGGAGGVEHGAACLAHLALGSRIGDPASLEHGENGNAEGFIGRFGYPHRVIAGDKAIIAVNDTAVEAPACGKFDRAPGNSPSAILEGVGDGGIAELGGVTGSGWLLGCSRLLAVACGERRGRKQDQDGKTKG